MDVNTCEQENIGWLLKELGIEDSTLGWNKAEGGFAIDNE
jgi:hypothetical protein